MNTEQNVKSAESHAEEIWDKYSEYIDDSLFAMDSVVGTSVIKGRYDFLRAAKDISEPLQQQIESMQETIEDQNKLIELMVQQGVKDQKTIDRQREALEDILKYHSDKPTGVIEGHKLGGTPSFSNARRLLADQFIQQTNNNKTE